MRPAVLAIPLLAGCLFARQDARIRPGGQIAVSTAVAYTPDAETTNMDMAIDRNDASSVRGFSELAMAYGWRRAELRFHVPLVQLVAGDDYVFSSSHFSIEPLLISAELYIQLVNDQHVTAGVGLETAGGGYLCTTLELSARLAVTATARALYANSDSGGTRSVLLQGQLALTYALDAKHDLRWFASGITHAGSAEPTQIRIESNSRFDPQGRSYVTADSMLLVGAALDWH